MSDGIKPVKCKTDNANFFISLGFCDYGDWKNVDIRVYKRFISEAGLRMLVCGNWLI